MRFTNGAEDVVISTVGCVTGCVTGVWTGAIVGMFTGGATGESSKMRMGAAVIGKLLNQKSPSACLAVNSKVVS